MAEDKYGDEIDEAHSPLVEAGQGEAEGFEQAEQELIEHSSHGDPGPDPTELAGEPEDLTETAYGEADEFESSELDPDETDR
jgi:hypothetical protein